MSGMETRINTKERRTIFSKNSYIQAPKQIKLSKNTHSFKTELKDLYKRSIPSAQNIIDFFHLLNLYEKDETFKLFLSHVLVSCIEQQKNSITVAECKRLINTLYSALNTKLYNQSRIELKTSKIQGTNNKLLSFEVFSEYHSSSEFDSEFNFFSFDEKHENIFFNPRLHDVFKAYGFKALKDELETKIFILHSHFNQDTTNWKLNTSMEQITYNRDYKENFGNGWFNDDCHVMESSDDIKVQLNSMLYLFQQGKCFYCGKPVSLADSIIDTFLEIDNGPIHITLWNHILCDKDCFSKRNGKPIHKTYLDQWVKLNVLMYYIFEDIYTNTSGFADEITKLYPIHWMKVNPI